MLLALSNYFPARARPSLECLYKGLPKPRIFMHWVFGERLCYHSYVQLCVEVMRKIVASPGDSSFPHYPLRIAEYACPTRNIFRGKKNFKKNSSRIFDLHVGFLQSDHNAVKRANTLLRSRANARGFLPNVTVCDGPKQNFKNGRLVVWLTKVRLWRSRLQLATKVQKLAIKAALKPSEVAMNKGAQRDQGIKLGCGGRLLKARCLEDAELYCN